MDLHGVLRLPARKSILTQLAVLASKSVLSEACLRYVNQQGGACGQTWPAVTVRGAQEGLTALAIYVS